MTRKIIIGIVITLISIAAAVLAVVTLMAPPLEEEEIGTVEARHQIAEVDADLSENKSQADETVEEERTSNENAEEEEDDKPNVEDIDIEIGNIFFKILEYIGDMEETMTPKEVADFKKEFDMLTLEQKAENINHAVNLIGDNNFAALSAILFDLSQPKEILETIFHDMLNRDEVLKNETLIRLAEMKDHPLSEDAAELLDEED